jgi:actin related protein 2/3 complex subunit 4
VLVDTPCQHIDGSNKPEIEIQIDKELILPSITILRTDKEFALIEPSINSLRISFKVKDSIPSPPSIRCGSASR